MKRLNYPFGKTLLLLSLVLPFACLAQVNRNAGPVSQDLKTYLADHPVEKAYLQFDKPYYAAGDTIYFKAYVTRGEQHKLSDLSGVLHVDLINTKQKIDRSIKLQLDSGIAWGDFELPDSLPAGNYRVRAYTQWMRNEGETGFFDKVIPVGSVKSARIPESLVKQAVKSNLKPDVQFFPESGNLVVGISSKIAFKVTGPNGLGMEAKGTLLDEDGREMISFASNRLGMGYFMLTPGEGKNYKAKVSYADGTGELIDIPKAEPGGIVLSVDNDDLPEASVRIEANKNYFDQNHGLNYTLVIYAPGTATTVSCKLDSPVIKLNILKRKLHTGVATVTLFSPQNEPLCERLLFVQNYDELSLNVNSDKTTYTKREKVSIKLNALNRKGDAAAGHFSVSVTDGSKVRGNEGDDNILTNLLLTSDVKGYIERPNYYFADTGVMARKDLDVLMLTQGYRRFEWKKVLDSSQNKVVYQPETGLTIEGQVRNVFNKPVVKGTVTLLQPNGGLLVSTKSDDKGMFRFPNLVFSDTVHLVLSAIKANGKNSTQITWKDVDHDKPGVLVYDWQGAPQISDTTMIAYVVNDKIEQKTIRDDLVSKGVLLKQVNIHSYKPDNQYYTQSLVGAGNADQVIHAKDVTYGGPLSVRLSGLIHGAHLGNGLTMVNNITRGAMAVIIDGSPGNLGDVSTDGFETIEVLQPPTSYLYGNFGINGILVVTTKPRGSGVDDITATGVLPIDPMGFYKARTFYSPVYDYPEAAKKQPDLRSTIYWNPELQTGKDGNTSFDFYNADGPGDYKVVVEGIDTNGNIGRQVYRYQVE